MAPFDPAAATAAYMATLPAQAHAKATAYTQGSHWLLLWAVVVTIVADLIILRTGLLARTKARIERRRPHPVWASVVVGAAYIVLDYVIELPWGVYAGWWREKAYGLTSQPFGGWFGEQLLNLVISSIVLLIFLAVLYALMRHAPRTWWAWAGGVAVIGVLVMLILAPVLIEPLFNTYTPAPKGPVRDAVVALAEKAGVPHDKIYIYNGSKQSNRYTANVSGLFGTARIAMSDTMFAQNADIAEVRGVVGHEMGHYKRGHILWTAAFLSLMAVLMLWLADRVFPLAARWMGAKVDSIADPAGLPVLAAIVAVLQLVATPIMNTQTRLQEADADRFSLEHANEPDGLARALVKTIDYRASSPSALEEWLFYDHPSVEHRVRKAMDWKAEHPVGRSLPP
jgi:STE24 endopeptidase